ncbi:HTTM domain-containing protein [Bdellovibrio sp. HCB2-146]|uniref:HTTM domain-containing protein n=1 Tax=Bdellovibrio sp. HCB2-146 TaxID=3394362 RepID=UPI0039BD0B6A
MTIRETAKAIDTFFFKPQPVNSVALMRILLGVVLFIHWFTIWSHLEIFWGPEGIVSLQTSWERTADFRINIFAFLPDDPRTSQLLALLHLGGVIGMIFGFFTRTSIAIAFFTLVSFHSRNHFILNSADVIMRNMLFFLFFTHSNDLYSLDAWIRRARGVQTPKERAPWALRLIQIQFCVIYIATVMYKMKGAYWAEGTAIYYATRLDEFVRIAVPLLNYMFVIKMLTWSTLIVEFALGTFVWIKELRYWILLAGVGLHLGIEVTMNIPLFEWIMIVSMMCMVDSYDLEKISVWIREKVRAFVLSIRFRETDLVKTR